MPIGKEKTIEPSLIIGLAIIAALIGVVSFIAFAPNPMKGVDAQTFCRIEGDRSRTVVILDVTDKLTEVQQQTLKNRLREVQAGVARFDRIDIFVIDEKNTNLLKPVATACNPGDPTQVDELTTGRKFIAAKFQSLFAQPLSEVFETALQAETASQSPIMEAIQAAAATTFDAEPRNHGKVSKHLVVISDMMQNSPLLSFYQGVPVFASFSARPEFRRIEASLTDVNVEVITIPRTTAVKVTDKDLVTFWTEFFTSQGATLFRWRNIS